MLVQASDMSWRRIAEVGEFVSVWVRGALAALQEYDMALSLGEDPSKSEYKGSNLTKRYDLKDNKSLVVWWNAKEKELRAAGRVTDDGVVRVTCDAELPKWTIRSIRKTWPGFSWEDHVALLIKCNGVLEECDMDAREMVVEVVREVVKQEMTTMFGTLLAALRAGTSELEAKADAPTPQAAPSALTSSKKRGQAAGPVRKCKVCRKPGHRRDGCPTKKTIETVNA